MQPAGLKAAITPGAWIAPTLLNGWVNYGTGFETAGYRKTPADEVQFRGLIRDGSMTANTVLFNLPAAYRPARRREFLALQGGGAACRLSLFTSGEVSINGVTSNAFLSLEQVRFDVRG